jgi:glycine dehydrogenase
MLLKLTQYEPYDFANRRHIGPSPAEMAAMLETLGLPSVDALIEETIPSAIRRSKPLAFGPALSERDALHHMRQVAGKNRVLTSLIGQGYYGTITPPVIQRNILENPAWYTAYTPYQPEISQGRLEALLNFQTMICDLTGLDIANASLLDEATAAAEGDGHGQTRREVEGQGLLRRRELSSPDHRADPDPRRAARLEVIVGDPDDRSRSGRRFRCDLPISGHLWPCARPHWPDHRSAAPDGAIAVVAADPLALTLLKSPGEMGADIAIGSTQRFGVPIGYGGPHAAYMACQGVRPQALMPGRIIGVSIDARGNRAYRLSLQTREQHIRREKATSNICTAQVCWRSWPRCTPSSTARRASRRSPRASTARPFGWPRVWKTRLHCRAEGLLRHDHRRCRRHAGRHPARPSPTTSTFARSAPTAIGISLDERPGPRRSKPSGAPLAAT